MVDEALDRLNAGDYGICLACEEPIPPKRLRAVSWARYCVACQESIASEMDEMAAWSR
jgi:DnaK suppressor protein